MCLSRTEESCYPSEDLRMASVVSRWRDPATSGQGRFDLRVMTFFEVLSLPEEEDGEGEGIT